MTPFEEKLLVIEQKKLLMLQEISKTLFDTLGSAETGDALKAIRDVATKSEKEE